ncbi:MAG TPA: 50S ribosomal protein L11 methyltransferase [Solirubrobacteraceae bacterium]|nr:50S ribosomal protein L11 methyltransferase [Solirubrobacteraceae bacterium]
MSWLNRLATLQYHASLVGDAERVDRLREAIHEVVRPGDVVVDLGTGSGLLAYFACQAGAARVFAIEEGTIINLARELALLNRFTDRIEFFEARSYDVELPERADVLITETLWNFGVGEGMIVFLVDARWRFLKPDARVIPAAVDLHVAPVQHDALYALLHDRPPDRHGIDLSPIRYYQVNNVHMPQLDERGFLGRPALLVRTELDETATPDFAAGVTVAATTTGVLHGICGWFRARLSPGVVLHNEPPSVGSSWAHAYFPLQNAVGVLAGDEISIRIETADDATVWRWRTDVTRAGRFVAAYDQTSKSGYPIARSADQGLPPRGR